MNRLALNLAYKFVAMSVMLAQVNLFCSRLSLPLDHPITEADVRTGGHFGPADTNDFSGSVVTDDYFFGFGRGHLSNFRKLGFTPRSDADVRKRNLELAQQFSLIDTNGAQELATNWLAKAGIDVATLELGYKRDIIQWEYYPDVKTEGQLRPINRKPIMLPVFQVEWRGALVLRGRKLSDRAIVSVTISGATKELLEYHVLDDSLFVISPIQIREPEKLLAIPNEDFQDFDASQRNKLVSKFAMRIPVADEIGKKTTSH